MEPFFSKVAVEQSKYGYDVVDLSDTEKKVTLDTQQDEKAQTEECALLVTRDRVTGNDIVSVNPRDPKNQRLIAALQQNEILYAKKGIKRKDKVDEDTFTLADERKRMKSEHRFLTTKGYSEIPYMEGECCCVTSTGGRRVYLRISLPIQSRIETQREFYNLVRTHSERLLGVSIRELVEHIHNSTHRDSFRKGLNSALKNDNSNTVNRSAIDDKTPHVIQLTKEKPLSELWVDKYAPKNFFDLLSDERTNREVLTWVKEWDPIVFRRPFVKSTATYSSALPSTKYKSTTKSPQKGASSDLSIEDNEMMTTYENGEHKETTPEDKKRAVTIGAHIQPLQYFQRGPKQKVLLLVGAPGVGKTTLAQIVARHAGYEPIAFNASDDRTPATFIPKLRDILETQSTITPSRKPKLLIIDEIDGVLGGEGKGCIDALVKMISDVDSEDSPKVTKKKQNRIQRPIICICNDMYAPALKPLRERALIFRLEPPPFSALIARLNWICKQEAVQVDSKTLQVLCELTNNDIRACLNTLQFLSRRTESLNANTLFVKSSFGRKDILVNIFEILKSIFVIQSRSSSLQLLSTPQSRNDVHSKYNEIEIFFDNSTTKESEFQRLYNLITGSGENSKVIQGCFENYLSIPYNDPLLTRTKSALEYFEYCSLLEESVNKYQFFVLEQYMPLLPVALHRFCSVQHIATPFRYPKTEFQTNLQKEAMKNITKSFLGGVSPNVCVYLNHRSVILDFVSYFIKIISPHTVRAATWQLLKEDEKKLLQKLIEIYVTYGMTWKEEPLHSEHRKTQRANHKGEESSFCLTPAIDKLIRFGDSEAQLSIDSLSDVQRQQLSVRIQSELLKRIEQSKSRHRPTEYLTPAKDNKQTHSPLNAIDTKVNMESHKEPEIQSVGHSTKKDFFAGFTKSSSPRPTTKGKQSSEDSNLTPRSTREKKEQWVVYKYHEGFTNAVKRNVYIRDFLD